jgi:tetratricopeptide (TPR) repeat protein
LDAFFAISWPFSLRIRLPFRESWPAADIHDTVPLAQRILVQARMPQFRQIAACLLLRVRSLREPCCFADAAIWLNGSKAIWLLTLVALVTCLSGCRTLRCKRESDETITLTRQLAMQGKDAQQKGQWDKAESCFAEAVQKSPHDERARLGYAESLWRRGAHEQAIVHMTEAVKLSGADPALMVQLGQMHLAQNNLPTAKRMAEKSLQANRNLPSAWALRANVYRAAGQHEEALADYHRALGEQPHYPEVQLALAELYSQGHKPERALATLQSLADQFPPGSVPADLLCRQGRVLCNLGRQREAVECFVAAAQLQPTPDLLYELAHAQLSLGDNGSGQLTIQRALQLNPQHSGALQLQNELASRQQQLAGVLQR